MTRAINKTKAKAKLKRDNAGRITRHDWNVRAVKTMPSGRYEVMVYDGQLPYSIAWLPVNKAETLRAVDVPNFESEQAALEAYAQAETVSPEILPNLPDWMRTVSYLHLMRLAPGVSYLRDESHVITLPTE